MRTRCSLLPMVLLLHGCTAEGGEASRHLAAEIVGLAIEAHGGEKALREASTWRSKVRRHQHGSSYVVTSYYRPGMVRLEQDLGNGSRSADVIGDPHCWGMAGVVVIPCSDETRENDRPRVLMEMAVQLWPLTDSDWELQAASLDHVGERQVYNVEAFYRPRASLATLRFDAETLLIERISVTGVRRGVRGSHVHEYSDFRHVCGVQMPFRNTKSFEGNVWVEEELIVLNCLPVDESLFVKPEQVGDGAIHDVVVEPVTVACVATDPAAVAGANVVDGEDLSPLRKSLHAGGVSDVGSAARYRFQDGSEQKCLQVSSSSGPSPQVPSIQTFDGGRGMAIYIVGGEQSVDRYLESLLSAIKRSDMEIAWPVRIIRHDNDGMGSTGEVIVELTAVVRG